MERRMFLAVILSFLAVSAWGMATGSCTPRKAKNGQTDAGAFNQAVGMQTIERLENTRLVGSGDTRPRVAHAQPDPVR